MIAGWVLALSIMLHGHRMHTNSDFATHALCISYGRWAVEVAAKQHGRVTWRCEFTATKLPPDEHDNPRGGVSNDVMWLRPRGLHQLS